MTQQNRHLLAREMKLCGAFLTGDFTLSSGKKSDTYLDMRMLTLSEHLRIVALHIIKEIKLLQYNPNRVGGMTSGADPIVAALLMNAPNSEGFNLRGFFTRKEPKGYGTQKLIEGHLVAGDRAVIVDDVATTGNSLVKTVKDVRSVGAEALCAFVIVDREEGAKEALAELNIPLHSLFTLQEIKSFLA